MAVVDTARRLLPAIWLGLLLGVAGLATPAPFALLPQADAGRVVSRILAQEAHLSLALGVLLLVLERLRARREVLAGRGSQFTVGMLLAMGTIFCTVAGYFGLQPVMAAAKAGQGPLSFGQLHAISASLYALKAVLVAVMAWQVLGPPSRRPSS